VLHVAQPGHWLGRLGLAQPIWIELGPASKKYKKKTEK